MHEMLFYSFSFGKVMCCRTVFAGYYVLEIYRYLFCWDSFESPISLPIGHLNVKLTIVVHALAESWLVGLWVSAFEGRNILESAQGDLLQTRSLVPFFI